MSETESIDSESEFSASEIAGFVEISATTVTQEVSPLHLGTPVPLVVNIGETATCIHDFTPDVQPLDARIFSPSMRLPMQLQLNQ